MDSSQRYAYSFDTLKCKKWITGKPYVGAKLFFAFACVFGGKSNLFFFFSFLFFFAHYFFVLF